MQLRYDMPGECTFARVCGPLSVVRCNGFKTGDASSMRNAEGIRRAGWSI